jgi:hypothetical protein
MLFHLLTSWNRALLEQLTVAWIIKNFPIFYEKFITVLNPRPEPGGSGLLHIFRSYTIHFNSEYKVLTAVNMRSAVFSVVTPCVICHTRFSRCLAWLTLPPWRHSSGTSGCLQTTRCYNPYDITIILILSFHPCLVLPSDSSPSAYARYFNCRGWIRMIRVKVAVAVIREWWGLLQVKLWHVLKYLKIFVLWLRKSSP